MGGVVGLFRRRPMQAYLPSYSKHPPRRVCPQPRPPCRKVEKVNKPSKCASEPNKQKKCKDPPSISKFKKIASTSFASAIIGNYLFAKHCIE